MKLDVESALMVALIGPPMAFFSYHSTEVMVFVTIPSIILTALWWWDAYDNK